MIRKLTHEEKTFFIDEIYERRFKGHENEFWYMPYEVYKEQCYYIDLDKKSLEIPHGTKEIKYGPFNRSLLKKIYIPDTVTNIGYRAFDGCDGLEEIIIPESVEMIDERAFYGCDNLKKIVIPKSVKHIGKEAFAYCNSLEEIVIENGIEYIGYNAFAYCDKLKNVTVPKSVIKTGGRIFDGCYRLKSIDLPFSIIIKEESIIGHVENAKVYYY